MILRFALSHQGRAWLALTAVLAHSHEDVMLGFLLSKNQKIARAEKKILNMYLQAPDRQYYLHQLRELGGEDAREP
ncbi:MAG: hypothetical protein RBU37_25765 [Myxococcota bacterium]|nr:hypothetical protein [Myxococcota bacterium]